MRKHQARTDHFSPSFVQGGSKLTTQYLDIIAHYTGPLRQQPTDGVLKRRTTILGELSADDAIGARDTPTTS